MVSKAAYLFASGMATRVRRNVNADTPLPPEIPHALNPLDGVIIDYWLGAAASGPITLDVLDATGAIVRHYSSAAAAPVAEAAKPPHPNFWVAAPFVLQTSAGMHRANWDLRYDAPPSFSHSFEISANPGLTPPSPEGPLALPGTYTVRLTANGVSVSQRVTVRDDPRSTTAAAALAAQHMLQMRMVSAMHMTWDGQQHVTIVRDAIARASAANPTAAQATAMASLRAAMDSAVGPADVRASGGGATFQSVNGALVNQVNALDNGDMAPTPAMRAAYASTCRELAAVQIAWQRLLQRDRTAFNAVLAREGVSAVPVAPVGTVLQCGAP